jgi:menaquinone-dependent protoporphyrinogen oxidase
MRNNIPQTMNRRKFLKLAGITLGVSVAACGGLGTLATRQPQIDFIENHYQGENKMNQRILVAYASKTGSTGEVAEAIGQTLAVNEAVVDVYPIEEVPNIQDYQVVIVGSAIRAGRWLKAATRFVETHQSYLSHIPTAYFTCCLTLREDTEQNRREALGYMDPVRSIVTPLAVGAFAGKLDYSKLSFLDGLMLKVMGGDAEGDFRHWEAIRAWAGSLQL